MNITAPTLPTTNPDTGSPPDRLGRNCSQVTISGAISSTPTKLDLNQRRSTSGPGPERLHTDQPLAMTAPESASSSAPVSVAASSRVDSSRSGNEAISPASQAPSSAVTTSITP